MVHSIRTPFPAFCQPVETAHIGNLTASPIFASRSALKGVTPIITLAAAISLTMAPATAQLINDPSEAILFNGASRFSPVRDSAFAPVKETANKSSEALASEESLASQNTKAAGKGKTEALPVDLQPELDVSSDSSSEPMPAASDDPIRAKAVLVDINSNTLNYDKDRDVYVATGSVHMVISEQNSELYADKLTYDQNQDLVIAEGAVTIIKDGQKTHGSYAKIDLSRKSALINDYAASVEKVRIQAKTALVNSKYVQYENGRIILTPGALQSAMKGNAVTSSSPSDVKKAQVSKQEFIHEDDLTHLSDSRELEKTELNDEDDNTGLSAGASAQGSAGSGNGKKSRFAMKMREVDVYRDANGYNQVIGRWPSVYYKNHKVFTLPSTEVSYDEPTGSMQYLGPDIGYDPDYGGMYFGPGWDFRAGEHGSVRVSPLVTYGGAGRRTRSGSTFTKPTTGPGVGGIVHYRDPRTRVDLAYNSNVGEPVLLGIRKLFDGKTNLITSMNEDYISGFMGYERPRYGAMLADTRKLAEFGKFRLDSYESMGYFKDEFYPTFQKNFFVKPKGAEPIYAGRAQLQAQFRNTEPLLRVGRVLDFGLRADVALAGYTTGDFAGLIRGGPTMNLHLGNRLNSSIRYFYAARAGETPFVFDSYYQGRQNVTFNNTLRVNDFLTVGMRSSVSLLKDNARNSLFTGNALYMLVGPKEVKMNLAYDVVRKRSYFGLNFYPGQGSQNVDFDKMRVFQPENYSNPVAP